MFDSYFSSAQILGLTVGFLLLAISAVLFEGSEKIRLSVILLLCATLLLKILVICLDPFLHTWDEQVHALVAKNLSHHFLKPTLYPDPILPYDYKAWWNNYIWVHKQPLFLWQMALSIKLFGTSIFAVRFPSALCLTFATYCIYRIGNNFATRRIGFYAAFFFSLNNYINELASGLYATDHNDVVAITYITASIWAFSEYLKEPERKKWIIFTGILAGLAVLSKWTIGLCVYSGWFFYILADKPKEILKISRYYDLLKSFAVSLLVSVPWQIFIFSAYPKEAAYEFSYNAKHFSHALEGHEGNAWYYYDHLSENYGSFAPVFCIMGLILLYRYVNSKALYLTILFYVTFVYAFFTIVATKMPTFPMIISAFIFLGFGAIAESFFQLLSKFRPTLKKIIFMIVLCSSGLLSFAIEDLQDRHTNWKHNLYFYYIRKDEMQWKEICESLDNYLPDKNYIIFNCPADQSVKLMFYSNYIGYYSLPSRQMINTIFSKNKKIAILDNGLLPAEVYTDNRFLIIQPPQFKAIKIDTVYIKTNNYYFLSTEPDGKLVCNNPNAKQKYIIKTFADGCSMIKMLNGPIAKTAFELGGLVVFNKNEYSFTEKFKLEEAEGLFKIKTEDNIYLKVFNNGERLVASKDSNFSDAQFEFIKARD